MRVSDLFVKCLEKEGVEFIFGLAGEENLDLLDSLSSSKIKFIAVRHEQGAAFMADVYGRLTGKAGVCLSTLGPGATNLVTGIADANMDRSPVVAITAQAGLQRIHKESHQAIDVVEMFRPIVKWNTRVQAAESVAEVVRKAFKLAQAEKPGACHIELPEDIAEEKAEGHPLSALRPRRPSPDRLSLKKAAELIAQAKFPLILAGNGVIRGQASEDLLQFVEKSGIPLAYTFMGKGGIPWNHPLCLMTIGLQAHDYVNCGFDQADLVVAVGYDIVEYGPHFWNPDKNKKIIHIDFTPAEVDAHYQPNVEVVADIRETLELLTKSVKTRKKLEYPQKLRQYILKEMTRFEKDDHFPVKPQRAICDLRKALGPSDLVISDVGAHKLWVARMYPTVEPNTVIISNGFASMGIALPGAIAAKLIYPKRNVVAVSGDGGFLMNVQELETAVRLKVNPVCVVFNDNGFGLIQWKQHKKFRRDFGVKFGNPDFAALAKSFGCKGYTVHKTADFKKVLAEALKQKVPSVIEVPIDYHENTRLTEELGNLVCPM